MNTKVFYLLYYFMSNTKICKFGQQELFGWCELEGDFAERETVVAGEEQPGGVAVFTDPFGRDGTGFAGADVPISGKVNGGPGAPGLRCVVNTEAALETGAAGVFTFRENLAPEVAF